MGPRRIVLDTASKLQRKKDRASLGSLNDLVVSKHTLHSYETAVKRWYEWHFKHFTHIGPAYFDLDSQLSSYINAMWEDGEGRALIANTLSGIQHYVPKIRYQLPSSWRLYKAWGRHELPARAPPLTKQFLEGMCGLAFSERRGDIAIALLIGFEGLLRTGELLALTKADIDISSNFKSAVLSLGLTKGGSRIGSIESVTLEDASVNKLLAARLLSLKPGDLLLPQGQAEFRKYFKHLLDTLKLTALGFKPYSLRRGGATQHFRETGQLSRTVVKGRWTNARTARVYINEGLAVLASFSCPEAEAPIANARSLFTKYTKGV